MTPGQALQSEGARLCQAWGEASSGPGSPVPWAPVLRAGQGWQQDPQTDTVRVHTRPTAPTGHLSPHHQLSPQPPPCWFPGGLCSLPALGPAGRSSAESILLRNGAKGRPTAPLLPHPKDCLEPRAARLSCFETPTSAVRGPPSLSLHNHPHPPKPDLPRSWKPNCRRNQNPLEHEARRDTQHSPHQDAAACQPVPTQATMARAPGAALSRLQGIQCLARNLSGCPGGCVPPPGHSSSVQNGNPPSRACPKTSWGFWGEHEKAAGETRETGGLAPTHTAPGPLQDVCSEPGRICRRQ